MGGSVFPVFVSGVWRQADIVQYFSAVNPATKLQISEFYPVSSKQDIVEAIDSASRASVDLMSVSSRTRADFLDRLADRIEQRSGELVQMAHQETGYPVDSRLEKVELPRMTDQIRQIAAAVRSHSWTQPVIDTRTDIRSMNQPLEGGVVIFGPNNFPLAYNCIGGSDFCGAVGTGNSVICKGHPSHPGTTRILAEEAHGALQDAGMPLNTFQLIYHMENSVGMYLVSSPKIGALAYTGSRKNGLLLKGEADRAGKPAFLELSSINPVLVLPGALKTRSEAIAEDLVGSCTAGTGQFCTKPGLVMVFAGNDADGFVAKVKQLFEDTPAGILLSEGVLIRLDENVGHLREAGARPVTGSARNDDSPGYSYKNTLLTIAGSQLIDNPSALQIESFGPQTMIMVMDSLEQAETIMHMIEGSLAGAVYWDQSDQEIYRKLVPLLVRKVGRLTSNKMTTGVAVVPSMNHGGPYPSTGHPAFSAVGVPGSMVRFTMRKCFDQVSELPEPLKNENPDKIWRMVDGDWTRDSIHG